MSAEPTPRPRVLWVEGNAPLLPALALSDLSVEMVRESSLDEALERLHADADFAVVVCDEDLGGGSGLELLAAVRSLAPEATRLLVREGADDDAAETAHALAFRCIAPEASPGEVLNAVRDALEYHQLLAAPPVRAVEEQRAPRGAIPPPAQVEPRRARVPAWRGFGDVQPGAPVLGDALAPPVDLVVLDANAVRVGLRVVGRVVELLPGLTVVGRSRSCHIPIPDPHISRRHATFSNTGREIRVRNVSPTNGVRVNGTPLVREASQTLQIGDRIELGSHEIEVCALGDYCPSFEPTHNFASHADPGESTSELSTLVTLAHVADKYFVLGQPREAERILRPLLEGLLRRSESGRAPADDDVELATNLTLRIAEANRDGEWINYVFDLFSALERALPADAIERLYRIVPEIQGIKMASFRAYLDALGRIQADFGPKERFLMRRIQGLETRLMMSAHL